MSRSIVHALALLSLLSSRLWSIDTFAAWSDKTGLAPGRGRIYVYSGPSAVNVSLYREASVGVSIAGLFAAASAGPYQPVLESPTFNGSWFFRLNTDNPVVWEIEENIVEHGDDSHDFLTAADTGRYTGQIFMSYLRDDLQTTFPAQSPNYGDAVALVNPGSSTSTVSVAVSRWSGPVPGGSWNPLTFSPGISPGGIWMWSPDQNAAKDSGGTDAANQGHYRFDFSGGEGLLYKGNGFSFYQNSCPSNCGGPERDNLMHQGVDWDSGRKVGFDLIGAAQTMLDQPHIAVTNAGSAAADFAILRFVPLSPPPAFPSALWPVDGDAPAGTWVTVTAQSGLLPDRSYYFDNRATLGGIPGFYRVVATNNQPLTAIFGASLVSEVWCDGDYLFATDTRRAYGRKFAFGGKFSQPGGGRSLEIHVVAPNAGTSVNCDLYSPSGALLTSAGMSILQPNAGARFSFSLSDDTFYTAILTGSNIFYAYVMSSNEGGGGGETFFSIPAAVEPVLNLGKSVAPATAALGETLTYTLVASNPGVQDLYNSALWDTLPPGVSLVDALPPAGFSAHPYYSWTLATLTAGSAVTVTVRVRLDTGVNGELKLNQLSGDADDISGTESASASFQVVLPTPTPTVTATATPPPTGTVTPTVSPTPSVTPTLTPTPPPLWLSPLSSSPNPAGPDGVYLAYRLSVDAEVTIKVFTLSGEPLRTFKPHAALAGANEQFWDARNESGQAVASGVFIAKIRARSRRDEESEIVVKAVIIR